MPGAGGRRAPVHEMDVRRVRRGRAERSVRTPADQRPPTPRRRRRPRPRRCARPEPRRRTAPGWVAELAQRGGQKSRRVAQQRRKVEARRRDAEAAREALREAQATAAQASSSRPACSTLAAYLAALDHDDSAPRAQALVAKMVAAKNDWRRDVDAMLSGEAPAANAREADDLLKEDEAYLEDLERAPDDAGGWARRFIEEPDLDAWPWGSNSTTEKMRMFRVCSASCATRSTRRFWADRGLSRRA